MLKIKRIYEEPSANDGLRILVDRLWPRGFTKERARIGLWAKEITPSDDLRKEFHAAKLDFSHFANRYREELRCNPALPSFVETVQEALAKGDVTFLYAAKDEAQNHAIVLRDFVLEELT